MAQRTIQEFVHSVNASLVGDPLYRNLDMAPGQQSPAFTIVNADGGGIYRVYMAWSGSGSVGLVNSSGATVVSPMNGGDTQIALPAGAYSFKLLSGSPTNVHAGISRVN